MKHTISLTPEEVSDAVREYLESRGYECGDRSTRLAQLAKVRFEFTSGHPEGPGTDGCDAGMTKCIIEGVTATRNVDADNDESELNR